ncbi:MAG TPA: hypothetical protein VFG68_09685 [Fimbriiglobus sp.]|nr:hypothetical protein [Fimbriiglobus sp.]
MVQGALRPRGTPVVPIEVAGQTFEAILDTGFEGGLQLPDVFQPIVGGNFVIREPIQYGDGSIGHVDVYEVTVRFDGEDQVLRTQFAGSDELILGIEALKDYRLEINFVARSVLLERVAPTP